MENDNPIIIAGALFSAGCIVVNSIEAAYSPVGEPPLEQVLVVGSSSLATGPGVVTMQNTMTGEVIIAPPFEYVSANLSHLLMPPSS